MDEIFVKPAPGRRVRIPARGYELLPEAGDFLPRDMWLIRRLADEDVVKATPPAVAPEPAKAPAKAG